jgi:hypothetical protein
MGVVADIADEVVVMSAGRIAPRVRRQSTQSPARSYLITAPEGAIWLCGLARNLLIPCMIASAPCTPSGWFSRSCGRCELPHCSSNRWESWGPSTGSRQVVHVPLVGDGVWRRLMAAPTMGVEPGLTWICAPSDRIEQQGDSLKCSLTIRWRVIRPAGAASPVLFALHQAAWQVHQMTGLLAPVEQMRAAGRAAIESR